jgi:cyclophilin family peptidyl-prolyl cis-trans isomerase
VANGCPASPTARANSLQYAAPTNMVRDNTLYAATVVTTAGTFRIALQQSKAPKSVNSFIFLAEKGYFTCNAFNRVVANGIDATGDPSGTGHGGPGYVIPAEQPAPASNPAHQYPLDTVALANGGGYDVGGSQWFVVTGPVGESLPNSFSVLGTVISGQSVLEKINAEGTPSGHPTVIERVLKVTIQVKTL